MNPIIFDCIEFNDRYRQIDVLYDVAFLCMDMEAAGHQRLSDVFLREYKYSFPSLQTDEDSLLFIYFKALRANVRAKVHALEASQNRATNAFHEHVVKAHHYLSLMDYYRRHLG